MFNWRLVTTDLSVDSSSVLLNTMTDAGLREKGPLRNVVAGETNLDFGWFSDYYVLLGRTVDSTDMSGEVSADGMSMSLVVSYF